MSKIGRMPIDFGDAKVDIKGQDVFFKGQFSSGTHSLPSELKASLDGKSLIIALSEVKRRPSKKDKSLWGLHRALLLGKIAGSEKLFEKQIKIVGLGYKGEISKKKILFSLGYSHKIDFDVPDLVEISSDKSGQLLTLRSADKDLLGHICSKICALRPVEPYKGTGVRLSDAVVIRKAGKAKSV